MTVYDRPNPGFATETNKLILHIRPRGFEPLTYGFVVRPGVLCFLILKDFPKAERGKTRQNKPQNATGAQPGSAGRFHNRGSHCDLPLSAPFAVRRAGGASIPRSS